jgi:predicted RNase H-like HicB family nuclease
MRVGFFAVEKAEARMEQGKIAFTAVYLKANYGYVGFIEELPGVNSHGRTLDEARETLHKLAEVVFDEERRGAEEMIAGKDVVRENFVVPIPRPAA